jgi:putative copper export protein
MNQVLLFLHIVAAAAWLGANVAQFVLRPRFAGDDATATARYLQGTVDMGMKLYTPAGVTLLVTGVIMVTRIEAFDFESLFVSIGFAMIVVGIVLGIVVFARKGREAAEHFENGRITEGAAVQSTLVRFGVIDTVLLLVTIAAMVGRWGA